ncbi:hypothetical protein [Actinomadura alba]|uniref:Uncharacterized protein n=1 Tax=Actinomadura alba TaxID=406431 RepID=A0ABR7LM77_9ACTN|nr:hypothetical protein [Actinomadura alba]MBC6465798.1 hypothetical protein [Actinomadura alba]
MKKQDKSWTSAHLSVGEPHLGQIDVMNDVRLEHGPQHSRRYSLIRWRDSATRTPPLTDLFLIDQMLDSIQGGRVRHLIGQFFSFSGGWG